MSRKEVIRVIQANTGRRIIVRPGARMLMIVTAKFSPPMSDEVPRISRPTT
jgi:hypothetical protein